MPHSVTLIHTVVAAFALALLLGFVAVRLRLPALLGYLLAGVVIGPFTPGFVADAGLASQLAEMGVMLLLFGVGLHFSWADLLSVRRIAVPGAIVQMVVATALGAALALSWGWSWGGAVTLGLALSVASTVVLLRALEAEGVLESPTGRIAVGWLVVEDLAMVLVLVVLPVLASALGEGSGGSGTLDVSALGLSVGGTLLQVVAFVLLMLVVGRRVFPWLLWQVARTGSRELFTLCVVAAAVGIAVGSAALFGVSFALGAFFAGMVLRESEFSHRAAHESLPLRDAFAVLFFVSVGMLFNPAVLWERPWQVMAVMGVVLLGKTLAAMALVLALRYPLHTALTISASLAQIGEFSFILMGLGASLGLIPPEGGSLVLAAALISIALNPLMFRAIAPLQRWLLARSALARELAQRDDPLAELPTSTDARYLARQVVLVGYGEVGRRIAQTLQARDVALVVAEQRREVVEALRSRGVAAVCGDAADPAVLVQAHVARAAVLVIAVPEVRDAMQMVLTARTLNPKIHTVVRGLNEEDARRLQSEGVEVVCCADEALAHSMAAQVLACAPHAAGPGPEARPHRLPV